MSGLLFSKLRVGTTIRLPGTTIQSSIGLDGDTVIYIVPNGLGKFRIKERGSRSRGLICFIKMGDIKCEKGKYIEIIEVLDRCVHANVVNTAKPAQS